MFYVLFMNRNAPNTPNFIKGQKYFFFINEPKKNDKR